MSNSISISSDVSSYSIATSFGVSLGASMVLSFEHGECYNAAEDPDGCL
jgi:hypothetical protein